MKHTIRRGLSPEGLRAAVPARYRQRLPANLPEQQYTLLLFRAGRNDVVLSRAVQSALAEVADVAGALLAVGGCFTAEGLELFRARRATVVELSEFHWTDESYQSISGRH